MNSIYDIFRPKKDQCSICLGHDIAPMLSAESENRYKIHLNNKVAARNIKSEAKAKAEKRNEKSSIAAWNKFYCVHMVKVEHSIIEEGFVYTV